MARGARCRHAAHRRVRPRRPAVRAREPLDGRVRQPDELFRGEAWPVEVADGELVAADEELAPVVGAEEGRKAEHLREEHA